MCIYIYIYIHTYIVHMINPSCSKYSVTLRVGFMPYYLYYHYYYHYYHYYHYYYHSVVE